MSTSGKLLLISRLSWSLLPSEHPATPFLILWYLAQTGWRCCSHISVHCCCFPSSRERLGASQSSLSAELRAGSGGQTVNANEMMSEPVDADPRGYYFLSIICCVKQRSSVTKGGLVRFHLQSSPSHGPILGLYFT